MVITICLTDHLMRFDNTRKLRGEVDVIFILWVIDIDEDSPLSIWLVDSIVKMQTASLTIILLDRIPDEAWRGVLHWTLVYRNTNTLKHTKSSYTATTDNLERENFLLPWTKYKIIKPIFINPSIYFPSCLSIVRCRGGWSQSQLTLVERPGKPRICHLPLDIFLKWCQG